MDLYYSRTNDSRTSVELVIIKLKDPEIAGTTIGFI